MSPTNKKRKVGCFSSEIIQTLNLNISAGTPIYISDSNTAHMKTSHPNDFLKYGHDIEKIISDPDYVGKNTRDNSIEFVKEYFIDQNYVKVAVRVSANNVFFARSLYVLNSNRVKNFIAKGTLKKLDKNT